MRHGLWFCRPKVRPGVDNQHVGVLPAVAPARVHVPLQRQLGSVNGGHRIGNVRFKSRELLLQLLATLTGRAPRRGALASAATELRIDRMSHRKLPSGA